MQVTGLQCFDFFCKARSEMDSILAGNLSNFYADDQRIIEQFTSILKLSPTALKDANKALGPAGSASPDNVGAAADVLHVYASAFEQSEAELTELSDTLRDAVQILHKS